MLNYSDFIIESSLSRIHNHIEKHSAGAITAWRGEYTRRENQDRNKKLLAYLQRQGYSVTSVKGSYIENYGTDTAREVGEHSFFVVNNKVEGDDGGQLEKQLIKLGRMFDQDSILTVRNGKATLIGTSRRENAFPNYGSKVPVGQGKFGYTSGAFFSRIRGRQFAFESIESVIDVSKPSTINGVRVRDLIAEEVERELDKLND